jgi:hypothetical protein
MVPIPERTALFIRAHFIAACLRINARFKIPLKPALRLKLYRGGNSLLRLIDWKVPVGLFDLAPHVVNVATPLRVSNVIGRASNARW